MTSGRIPRTMANLGRGMENYFLSGLVWGLLSFGAPPPPPPRPAVRTYDARLENHLAQPCAPCPVAAGGPPARARNRVVGREATTTSVAAKRRVIVTSRRSNASAEQGEEFELRYGGGGDGVSPRRV